MPANPFQRKEISIEKLKTLRTNLREAFQKSTGDALTSANNKANVLYEELRDDIIAKADKEISLGTIHKLLYGAKSRTYQIIIIQTIEKYISVVMSGNSEKKDSSVIENKISEEKISHEIKAFVKRIYLELKTRKAAIPIDEDNDVIEEIYNSWHKLFPIFRDELEKLPSNYLKDLESPKSIVGLTNKTLNETLRLHLTEHQAKFRSWLQNAKNNPKNKNVNPQELQKKYPDYIQLMQSMKEMNTNLKALAEKFSHLF